LQAVKADLKNCEAILQAFFTQNGLPPMHRGWGRSDSAAPKSPVFGAKRQKCAHTFLTD
jgi:hypothetical protein